MAVIIEQSLATAQQLTDFQNRAMSAVPPTTIVETDEKKVRTLSLKAKASATTKDILTSLRQRGLAILGSLLGSMVSSVLDSVASVIDLFKMSLDILNNLKNDVNSLLQGEKLKGQALKKHAKQTKIIAKVQSQVGPVETATQPTASDPRQVVTSDTIGEIMAAPASNDIALENASELYRNKRGLEKSASQPPIEQLTIAIDIYNNISNLGIPEMREWCRTLLHGNRLTDQFLLNLPLCQPSSEYIASWFKAFTPDKPSLQLYEWTQAKSIRDNLKYKLRAETHEQIEGAYSKLNKDFYDCIPSEFYLSGAEPPTVAGNCAHGYHVVGDFLFTSDHMSSAQQVYNEIDAAIMDNLGDRKYMIDYMFPVVKNIEIKPYLAITFADDYQIPMEGKGGIYRTAIGAVNNTVLKPSKPNEY